MMQSLKVGAVIAVVPAVLCSLAVVKGVKPLEVLLGVVLCSFGGAAIAAAWLLKTLGKDVKKIIAVMQSTLEKVSYVEHRLDALGGHLGTPQGTCSKILQPSGWRRAA